MTYPIPGVGVSTPYGKRGSMWSCNEDANGNGIHTGVDFACNAGTDITAPIRGQIRHRSYGSAFGNHQFAISPDPGQPFGDGEVFFAHTTDRPKDGVWVEVGDYIASVGAEGNVSGPHLHMEYHADTKGSWSCSVIDDPQPVLDYQPTPIAPTNPTNPNKVKVGEKVVVTANGSLNGRSGPGSTYPVVTSKPEGATFVVQALVNGWAGDTEQPSQVKTRENADSDLESSAQGETFQAPLIAGEEVTPTGSAGAAGAQQVQAASSSPGVPVYDTDYLYGIDISSNNDNAWQSDTAWQYAFVKTSEGKSYANEKGNDQRSYIRNRLGYADHYHWLNSGDVQAQVDWFVSQKVVKTAELIGVDWEYDKDGTATCAQKDQAIKALQKAYPNSMVGLYTNEDYWYNHDTTSFYGDFLWIAHPGSEPTIKAEWLFWQYDWGTDAKPLDKNHGKFADAKALRAWAGSKGSVTPPEPPPQYTGNWFSTDYLDQYEEPPPPAKPGWKSTPAKVLSMDAVPGSVSYLQGVCRVDAMTCDDGTKYNPYWIVAQDYNNEGNIRFLCFRDDGTFVNWMQVNDAGHGQTFYAYRSAAGNLYVWAGEDPAYRYAWKPGKTVSRTSGEKMDYKGARPMGGYVDRIMFRDATDTKETFYLFDRTDFTDGTNRTKPIKQVTLTKDTSPTQQGWWASESRIYRLRGSTNEDTEHNHDGLHRLDVYDWNGTALLRDFDVTDMHRSGCTEDEPEGGVVFTPPGPIYAGKREGSASASKRDYVLWQLEGMP